ncbi:unnamed protein product [Adineta ricciae]|uniref:Aldehyde dehydrogenase domain-containing protein n=1 Tax=Adineta ricciae TaxID=249248 RepID=A0A813QAH9_ADIRI|nr:unnamed protein product [Adineta ricciae]
MLVLKLGPTLTCGKFLKNKNANVVILKLTEQAPLTAGFPPGVVNTAPGGSSSYDYAIATHDKINKMVFTGSVEIGKKIPKIAGKTNLKSVLLELSDKSPLIICDNVDLDLAGHNST